MLLSFLVFPTLLGMAEWGASFFPLGHTSLLLAGIASLVGVAVELSALFQAVHLLEGEAQQGRRLPKKRLGDKAGHGM